MPTIGREIDAATPVPLDHIICTDELERRPQRSADFAAESRALLHLAHVMADAPRQILQTLTDEALLLCRAGSTGISIIEDADGEKIFRWQALSGAYSVHLGATMPRIFSPCGAVVDRNAMLLMARPERHYTYIDGLTPAIVEVLLIPFTVNGRTIGTIWAVTHDEQIRFDREDARLLRGLGVFAAAAYNMQLALDASKETDRRKDEFMATVAHELRNPLSAARSGAQFVQLRLNTLNDPQALATNALVQRQLVSMGHMIDGLMDLARIRLDKVELKKERVSVATIVQQGVDSALPIIEASRHKLEVSLPTEPLWVEGDPLRLTQIMSNLLSNAAKYTPKGGQLQINAEQAGGEIVIRVRDNGIGIAESMLPRVFDLYAQESTARERAQGGLGIGLTVVQKLAELHGGRASVKSNGKNQGSEFSIHLPAVRGPIAISTLAEPTADDALVRPLRILVVDDNEDAADSLSLLLSTYGHQVRTAYTGASALQEAETFSPEVTLQDLGMPGIDGYEIARRLRQLPQTRHAVLIALTGYSRPEDAQRALSSGFDRHLTKPVDFDALDHLLHELCRQPTEQSSSRLRP